jgi:excisionase family DNA binding protein
MEQLRLSDGRRRVRERAPREAASSSGTGTALTREDILNAAEVAELLQLRRSTVEDYARRGLLPSIKLGRFRRFVRADLEAAVARLRDRGGAGERPWPYAG